VVNSEQGLRARFQIITLVLMKVQVFRYVNSLPLAHRRE